MEWLFVIIMAVFQGVAEFLPISSSGHLAVLGTLFGFNPDANMALGVVLHAGTLLAILVFYVRALLAFLTPARFHLALMVIAGSIPAGIIGILLKKSGMAEELFNSLLIVGCGFIVTGAMLQYSEKKRNRDNAEGDTAIEKISLKQAVLIGCAQAVAILPGISRSGTTISAGLFCRLRPAACAEFSFLLAIPAIGGAAFLELLDMLKTGASATGMAWPYLLTGFLLAAAVGYFALTLLVKMLNRGNLAVFSYYLYAVGTVVLVWQILK